MAKCFLEKGFVEVSLNPCSDFHCRVLIVFNTVLLQGMKINISNEFL